MSWQATSWAQEQTTGSAARKALLLVLANYADEYGICWPSQDTLSKATELSMDTIQRHLKVLVKMGLLEVGKRDMGRGRWPSNVYVLKISSAPQNAARSDKEQTQDTPNDLNIDSTKTEPHLQADHAATTGGHRAAMTPPTVPQALRQEESIEPPKEEPSDNLQAQSRKLRPSAVQRMKAFRGQRFPVEVIQHRIAMRLGANGWAILGVLSEKELSILTGMEESGRLSDAKVNSLRQAYAALMPPAAAQAGAG